MILSKIYPHQHNSKTVIFVYLAFEVLVFFFFFPMSYVQPPDSHFTDRAGFPWASCSSSCPQMPMPELLQRRLNCS